MSCNQRNKELINLRANVVNAIRGRMRDFGAIESYYDKISAGTGACENVPTAFILQNARDLSFLSQTDQLLRGGHEFLLDDRREGIRAPFSERETGIDLLASKNSD